MFTPSKDDICRIHFSFFVNDPSSYYMNVLHGIIIAFVLVSNVGLITAVLKGKNKRSLTRNEKLVLLLSFIDLTVSFIQAPLKIFLIKKLHDLQCSQISLIAFWYIFPTTFTGAIIFLISIERLIVVVYNNRLKCINFTECHLMWCAVFLLILCLGMSVCFSFVIKTGVIYFHYTFYFVVGTYTLFILTAVTILNIAFLLGTKRKFRESSIPAQRNLALEKYLTKTITLISINLVLIYLPSVIAVYYAAIVLKMKLPTLKTASVFQNWSLVLCEVNSALNALIYIFRNRKFLRLLRHHYQAFLGRMGLTIKK